MGDLLNALKILNFVPAAAVVLLTAGCPEGEAGDSIGTATDSGGAGTDAPSTSTGRPEPEPEPETAGSACGEPLAGQWGDCINENTLSCGNEDASCLANATMNPAWGSCILPCTDVCDCWAAPADGAAESACAPVLPGGESACVLDCTEGQACPDGMRCVALTGVQSLCAFDAENFDPTTGDDPDPTTGDDGTTTTGDGSTSTGGSSSESSGSSSGGGSTSTGGA
ncbi:MAG: hypothetical protein AAGA54_24225 [Myxococcota bacterium]